MGSEQGGDAVEEALLGWKQADLLCFSSLSGLGSGKQGQQSRNNDTAGVGKKKKRRFTTGWVHISINGHIFFVERLFFQEKYSTNQVHRLALLTLLHRVRKLKYDSSELNEKYYMIVLTEYRRVKVDSEGYYEFLNSYGPLWGDGGFGYVRARVIRYIASF